MKFSLLLTSGVLLSVSTASCCDYVSCFQSSLHCTVSCCIFCVLSAVQLCCASKHHGWQTVQMKPWLCPPACLATSQLLLGSGAPHFLKDLTTVSAGQAKTIVVLNPDKAVVSFPPLPCYSFPCHRATCCHLLNPVLAAVFCPT